jgi:formylmethanofuran dehydrogenase subunit E
MRRITVTAVVALSLAALSAPTRAEHTARSPQDWVTIGGQVHGGFGTLIALGIRIGQDALKTLGVDPRQVEVTLIDGPKSPCACIVDGVMVATSASPGQRTLQVSTERAADGVLGVVVVRDRKSGRTVRYTVEQKALEQLGAWNKALDPLGRYHAVMSEPAERLYSRELP